MIEMQQAKYESVQKMLSDISSHNNIHIECNQETAERVFAAVREYFPPENTGYMLRTDRGYRRLSVQNYLGFWSDLWGGRISAETVIKQFGLDQTAGTKMERLTEGEHSLVQIARLSMQPATTFFLMEPLLNLKHEAVASVLAWMEERMTAGCCFVTTNASLRCALLMPGKAYYEEDGQFLEVEQEEDPKETCSQELSVLKIAVKSDGSTLLVEPKDIAYIESLNKNNYVSVRGTLYPVSRTMDELEAMLANEGFFRCHRSYIVNMQKVGRIEKTSKNSYSLLLNNKMQSQIPLSKARVGKLKETFDW